MLEDALLPKQTLASLRRVFAPKVAGLRNLAGALAAGPPAVVALFSSIASMLGSPGQGNYAAANAALDSWALAVQRQVSNYFLFQVHLPAPLPGVHRQQKCWRRCCCAQGCAWSSLQWGAWSSVGMAAASPPLLARLQRQVTSPFHVTYAIVLWQNHTFECVLSVLSCPQGYGAVSPIAGLTLLHAVLASNLPSGVVAINPFDWVLFLRGALPCLKQHHARLQ